MRPPLLLVGEAPGGAPGTPAAANHVPLYPYPPECAGERLFKMTGFTKFEYVKGVERVNLIPDRCPVGWPRLEAEGRAAELHSQARLAGQTMVIFGARVKRAFGIDHADFRLVTVHGVRLACMPHPSGRNLIWNSAEVRDTARAIFDDLRPHVRAYLDRKAALAS